MPSDDFPNAPDMGREFFNNKRFAPREQSVKQEPVPTQQQQELDHLELTLDHTPGGELEQDVHTQLSDNARREYAQRMQKTETPRDDYYINQIQNRFDKQIAEAERQKEEEQSREELKEDPKSQELEQQTEQTNPRQAPDYDMPENSQEVEVPMQSPPHDQGAKLRPGRSDRGAPDRSGNDHEH